MRVEQSHIAGWVKFVEERKLSAFAETGFRYFCEKNAQGMRTPYENLAELYDKFLVHMQTNQPL